MILLVEDGELPGEILQKTLVRADYTIIRAHNGLEALRIDDSQKVDLILTDLIMPGLEGVELIFQLNRLHPEVKIIAMSGGGRNRPDTYLQIARRPGVMHTLGETVYL